MQYERCFVKSFGWYDSPEHLFIAMEYLELGDLKCYLDDKPPLPEHEAREITRQILDGLFLMHDNDFAHRDLKTNVSLFFIKSPRNPFLTLHF
jgi:serine/threonine protein kinase